MDAAVEGTEAGATEHLDAFGLDLEIGNEPLPGMEDGFEDEPTPEESQPAEASPAPEPTPADPVSELRTKLTDAEARGQNFERQLNQLTGMVAPLVQQLAGRQPGSKEITRDQLNSPDATIEDLVAFMDQNQQRQQAALLSNMQATALRANSEQRFRGMLSKEALGGDGRDFDAVRQKYLAPVYEANPVLRQVIDQQFGQDPAIVEYGLAMLLKLNEMHKDDPVKTYRALHDFMEGKENRGIVERIEKTARSGADRVRTPASRADGARSLTSFKPGEMARTSDEEFAAIERELGFSGGF